MSRPTPTRIFHITPIANLAGICGLGGIRVKNFLAKAGVSFQSIAHTTIQARRATKEVTAGPGGVIHDYVPFYFAPRSPMLSSIHNGKVENCPWKQDDIIHIESTVEGVLEAGRQFVIYPISAAQEYSTDCFDTLNGLDHVNWPLFFEEPLIAGYCKYFHSKAEPERYMLRSETRRAEFLVHEFFPLSAVTRIGVINDSKRDEVQSMLEQIGVKLQVEVQRNWYFLGQ